MEIEKVLYVFMVDNSPSREPYTYMGDVLDEVSVFAEDERTALNIIGKEMSWDLLGRLTFKSKQVKKLYGHIQKAVVSRLDSEEGATYQIRRL